MDYGISDHEWWQIGRTMKEAVEVTMRLVRGRDENCRLIESSRVAIEASRASLAAAPKTR